MQTLIEGKDEPEKLRGLQIGTVLNLTGMVVADERAPGGAELHEVKVEVLVPVADEPPIEIDKPISHKSENLDTLFEYRAIGLRNLQEQKIFKIRASLIQALRQFLVENEFVEIDTPKLLAEATEGGAEVFKLDYFEKTATLAQSPQFYKQMIVGVFERVFEIGHSYRAEPSVTTRHLTELTMLDLEMGIVQSHKEVMDMVANLTKYSLETVYEKHADDLKSLNAPTLKLTDEIPSFTIAEIHELYTKPEQAEKSADQGPRPSCNFSPYSAKKQCADNVPFVASVSVKKFVTSKQSQIGTDEVRTVKMVLTFYIPKVELKPTD